MPLDPSIYSQIQQPQQVNPLAQLAQASQIQGAQQQNRLAALQMQEYERARSEAEAQRGVVAGFGADQTANYNALLKSGNLKAAQDYQQSSLNQRKTAADAEAAQFKLAHEKTSAFLNILGGAKDQASYDLAKQQAQSMGVDVAGAPAAFDPRYVSALGNQALTAQQRLEASLKERGFDVQMRGQDITRQNSIDTNATSRANNSASVGATIRGQNMTDSRQRETNANGRVPSGYRQLADGTLEFIPGGPADPQNKAGGGKPLTEGQSKSLLFASRMAESETVFDDLAKKGITTAVPGSTGQYTGAIVNALSGENNQRITQAKRDWLNANLRRESGALISPEEFDNGDKQYFPQVGDSGAVIAQKKRNREIATRGIAADVPDSENRMSQVRTGGSKPAASNAPKAGTVQDGYRFKGGNPADPSSWEKI